MIKNIKLIIGEFPVIVPAVLKTIIKDDSRLLLRAVVGGESGQVVLYNRRKHKTHQILGYIHGITKGETGRNDVNSLV